MSSIIESPQESARIIVSMCNTQLKELHSQRGKIDNEIMMLETIRAHALTLKGGLMK